MKLVLRSALVVALVALGLWWLSRRGAESAGATAPGASESRAESRAPEQLAPVDERGAAEVATQTREEVAVAPPATTASTASAHLRVLVVTKEREEPIAGVRFLIVGDNQRGGLATRDVAGSRGRVGESPVSGADGRVEFDVEYGVAYQLEYYGANIEGGFESVAALAYGETRELVLRLTTEEDLLLCGHVVDDASGEPVVTARVRLTPDRDEFKARAPSAAGDAQAIAVDADGRFEVRGKSWELNFGFAGAEGYATVVFGIERGHETREHALELRLARTASLAVTVRDANGTIEGAQVELSTPAYAMQQASSIARFYAGPDPHWRAQTDALGVAQFDALPPKAPLTIETRARDHEMRQESDVTTLKPGEKRAIEVRFGSGGVVRGRVADRDGQPVAGLQIWRVPTEDPTPCWFQGHEHPAARISTDSEGRFVFSDVPRGIWSIGPSPAATVSRLTARPEYSGLAQAVELRDGTEQIEIALVVDTNQFVRGKVVDPADKPVAQCHVWAQIDGGRAYANATSDENGAFELGPMPAGTWLLTANMHHGEFAPSEETRADTGATDVVLRLRAGGTLRGRVIDARTRQLTPCELSLAALDENFGGVVSGSRDGTFAFESLLPGWYVLSARTTDSRHAHKRVEVRPGVSIDNLELVLAPAAQLTLRYSGAEGNAGYTVSINGDPIAYGTLQAGTAESCVVPAGTLQVRWNVFKTDREHTQSLTMAPGETRDVEWAGKP